MKINNLNDIPSNLELLRKNKSVDDNVDPFNLDVEIKTQTHKDDATLTMTNGTACSGTCASCNRTCGNCQSVQRVCR